jgi:Lon-like protease
VTERVPRAFALIPAAIIILAVLNLNIPYYALRPGPLHDVLPLIGIKGAQTYPAKGRLLLTTVELQPVTTAYAIRAWIDPAEALVEREAFVPPGETDEDVRVRTTEQMAESQVFAAAAALRRAGYDVKRSPSGVRVAQVIEGSAAARLLRPGDLIVAIDGSNPKNGEELQKRVRRHRVGDTLTIRIRRGATEQDIKLKTIPHPDDKKFPAIGVTIETLSDIKLPIDIRIDAAGIGGPSAGLMYALGIIERLGRSDLARGRSIAGTGTIDFDGVVGAVGGIEQKVVAARRTGATVFLAPQDEQRAACPLRGKMLVVGVERLDDAVLALTNDAYADDHSCEAISARTGLIGRRARG